MTTSEMLLGFDCRRSVEGVATDWDAKRREAYLFRTDVAQPLSTDTTVWPAVLGSELRPRVCIGHQDLWSDLECLRMSIQEAERQSPDQSSLIAVTLHLTESDNADWDFGKFPVPPTTPSFRAESWSFAGYDVSDRWLLSGLSNCGIVSNDDKEALRREWGSKLNQYHLFTDLERAIQFGKLSNLRAAEHSPFFVFGIWLIRTTPRMAIITST